ncbi:hypothetical protein [Neobacillus sp. 19]|uniref:hypothetical protein n=1 Tax=Neobacillus sp. 19 TaxID=3394458 RepID=UPI003BF70F54
MNDKEALELIKKQFAESLKDGLLNLQVDWLIKQAEKVGELEGKLKRSEKERWKTANNLFNCRKKLKEIKQITNS